MVSDTETIETGFKEMNDVRDSGNANGNGNHENTLASEAPRAEEPKQISVFDAIQHLVKGNLGPGCLNIPHAFASVGWVLGLFLFTLVAIQGIYSMVLLVYCKRWIRMDQKRRLRESEENSNNVASQPVVTFMDIARCTHGTAGAVAVQVLLFILQAGVCCVFLSLIATNLHASVPHWDKEWCVCLVTVLLLVVVLIRDLKELKWLSLGANCLMVTAVLTAAFSALWVLSFASANDDNDGNDDENDENNRRALAKTYTSDPEVIASFIASMFYSFEGIGLVMPVENSFVGYHRNESDSDSGEGAPSGNGPRPLPLASEEDDAVEESRIAERTRSFVNPVLAVSMATVALLFLLIGSTCGPAFPDIIDGSVTAYLTTKFPDSKWYQVVNASVMVAVFLTFPLQLTPAMEVLGEWFGPGCDPLCFSESSGGGGCCFGGSGLLSARRRRRAGPRSGGRHTRVQDGDDQFQDEHQDETDEPRVVVEEEEQPRENNQPAVAVEEHDQRPLPPLVVRKSCFGSAEWIFRRYLVVFGCALVVLAVNDLGLLMSFFGALGNTGLAAMPCLIHWKLMQEKIAPQNFLLMAVDAFTIIVSLGVAVIGVSFSLREIVR